MSYSTIFQSSLIYLPVCHVVFIWYGDRMPVKWLEFEEVMTNCGPLIALMWPLYGIFFSCPPFVNSDGPENFMTYVTVTEHGP